ncbi:MAG TPA: type IV toxin-antitoxin system AbiEi family antitoxin domain-containing protein [Solirubrobacterales bacterium]|nr:type IV toxin-antitoxin system AbiEi family antitoxin domain-containing protein [Solirubrobacterales bacterium]
MGEIAARQHGVITTRQLVAAGIGTSGIAKRVGRGSLHRIHRGVYAVGHRAPSREREWMAAVLACGEGAALSHRSAAAHWGLLPAAHGPVDVAVPSQVGRSRRAGIRVHRPRALGRELVVLRNKIPVTTPARTLADLQGDVPQWLWRKAVRQAEFKKLALGPGFESDGTRSDLERDFLRLCRRIGVPAPEVNVRVGGWTVDFLWRRQRVAVETDFYDYHRGRVAFQDDHRRDLALRGHGLDVRRYSEEQLNERPGEVAADLRAALAAGSEV